MKTAREFFEDHDNSKLTTAQEDGSYILLKYVFELMEEYATQKPIPVDWEKIKTDVRDLIDESHQPLDITGLSSSEVNDMEKEFDAFVNTLTEAILSRIKSKLTQ